MDIVQLIIALPIILFSLTIHEYAHGFVAYKCGDKTARDKGRLTMNPVSHLDPIGTLLMIGTLLTQFIPFGWAKPVPIDPRNFKKPKRGIMLVSLAGPMANIAAVAAAVIINKILSAYFLIQPMVNGVNVLEVFALVNVGLAVFNMLPFAPLDGSKVIIGLLPDEKIGPYLNYSHNAGIVFMVLLIAESMLKIKTISYILGPLFGFFRSFVTQLFLS